MPETPVLPSIPTRILLPIDFSPSSQTALETAADLAQHFHAELFLVNVIPFFPATTFPDFVPEESFLHEARKHVEQHLAKCHTVLTDRGIKTKSIIEVGNDVVGNILEVIEREHIDLVVHLGMASADFRLYCREGCEAGAVPALAASLCQA
jgi:nucleotide-binding universal stress UspA family protein